jgi:hypothetical protein
MKTTIQIGNQAPVVCAHVQMIQIVLPLYAPYHTKMNVISNVIVLDKLGAMLRGMVIAWFEVTIRVSFIVITD